MDGWLVIGWTKSERQINRQNNYKAMQEIEALHMEKIYSANKKVCK